MKKVSELKEDLVKGEELLNETMTDPPTMVVFKRKAIRMFPSGERVALYVNDRLGLQVSVPYMPGQIGGTKLTAQIKESSHDNMFGEYIFHITKGNSGIANKIGDKVKTRYGVHAFKHFHNAANYFLNGDEERGAKSYNRFERVVNEEMEKLDEAVIHKLHHINSTGEPGDIRFKNGAQIRVTKQAAALVMKLHNSLTPENKQKVEHMVNSSPEGFQKVASFAETNLKLDKIK